MNAAPVSQTIDTSKHNLPAGARLIYSTQKSEGACAGIGSDGKTIGGFTFALYMVK